MTPVAVLAGVGAVDLWKSLRQAHLAPLERRSLAAAVLVLGLAWAWQREQQMVATHSGSTVVATSPITEQLRSLGESGHTMFSMSPTWTFAAHQVQTPSELTVIPLKRAWSGQINDTMIAGLLASDRVDAIVLNQSVLNQSAWSNLLAGYFPTAREGQNILFVRRELNPKPIDLSTRSETTLDLRRLGLGSAVNGPATNPPLGKPILTHDR